MGAFAALGGAAIGGLTSEIGAGKQADATKDAANLQAQSTANSLAFSKDVYADNTANEQPYMTAGASAENELSNELAPGGSLAQGWTTPFSFSGVDLQNDPAYQFDLDQGQQSVQRSAAAQGGLVSGGAMKDLDAYTQGYASNQYQQSYANALAQYQQAYNVFENNQSNLFNRQSSLAGTGLSATNALAGVGTQTAGTVANTSLQGANNQGNYLTQSGVASSAGTVGLGNSVTNGINQYANYLASNGSGSSYTAPATAAPSAGQWAAYDAGSTPGATISGV